MRKFIFAMSILCLVRNTVQAQSFLEMQLRNERVNQALKHSDFLLRQKFERAGVSYPPKYVYWRAFKTERELELWAGDDPYKPHKFISTYEICRLSGVIGFKSKEGDEQIPEGCYNIDRYNPYSNYFLSFRVSYPNGVDSFWGYKPKLGGQIFVHGDCATVGCLSMTDSVIQEIYWASIQAQNFQGFGSKIPIHIFPFRPGVGDKLINDDQWFAGYKNHEKRWENLFFAYYHFERARFPAFGYHDRNGLYAFDTLPPKKPRILTPIFWNPNRLLAIKSPLTIDDFALKRILKSLAPVDRDYIILVNKKSIENKTNFLLKSRYIEIEPDPNEWRPANAPKRYRKVTDTIYVELNPN